VPSWRRRQPRQRDSVRAPSSREGRRRPVKRSNEGVERLGPERHHLGGPVENDVVHRRGCEQLCTPATGLRQFPYEMISRHELGSQNVDRILLALAGIAVLVVTIVIRDSQALASVMAVLGVALLILGILLPRVRAFSIGSKGIEAHLGRIEAKVDMLRLPIRTALANLIARGDQVANALLVAQQMVER
jgi:hypothetical protein